MRRAPLLAAAALLLTGAADPYQARIDRLLKRIPLVDGHNDWAEALAEKAGEARWTMPLDRLDPAKFNTDIERLRQGRVGAQFWSVWVSPTLPGPTQVEQTVEQIALVRSLVRRYPDVFAIARTAADVRRIHAAGRVASMIGVEGGGQIDERMSVLQTYRDLGAGYLTLTHTRTINWADSATDVPRHDGLTPFGVAVVRELNRLGMLVDLSHVSEASMTDAIAASRAPVIFSHSGARAICDSPRNVSDAVLRLTAANGGVVMAVFAPGYVSEERRRWDADRNAELARYDAPPYGGLYIGQPERAKAALAAWDAAHPRPVVTIAQVADHVDHIAKVAGHDHVGIGSDFDGVGSLPQGLDSVATYPALFAELMRRGWSDADLAKLAGGNVLRVMAAAERVAATLKDEAPASASVATLDGAAAR